jgi:hypothetical protein
MFSRAELAADFRNLGLQLDRFKNMGGKIVC